MSEKIISLVKANPNQVLIDSLREMLADAEAGEIVGVCGVELGPDSRFKTIRIGSCSDLELAGALSFATHDLISGNPKK